MTADYQQWQPQLSAVGTLRAVRGVDVTTEVVGLVRSIEFKSGDEVKAGQVVGIITAGEATSFRTTTSSVAYAIPSNTAVRVANAMRLRLNERSSRWATIPAGGTTRSF